MLIQLYTFNYCIYNRITPSRSLQLLGYVQISLNGKNIFSFGDILNNCAFIKPFYFRLQKLLCKTVTLQISLVWADDPKSYYLNQPLKHNTLILIYAFSLR